MSFLLKIDNFQGHGIAVGRHLSMANSVLQLKVSPHDFFFRKNDEKILETWKPLGFPFYLQFFLIQNKTVGILKNFI